MYVSVFVFAHTRPSLKLLCSSIPLWYLQKNRSYVQCTDDHLKYLLALKLQMEMVPFIFSQLEVVTTLVVLIYLRMAMNRVREGFLQDYLNPQPTSAWRIFST